MEYINGEKTMHNNPNKTEVVLIRHAQSTWNRENRFTGWADPPLTEAGIAEARKAGQQLREAGYQFDHAYSSRLQRAQHTLELLLEELGQSALPAAREWRLNERHYGALQGLNKDAMTHQAGLEQVKRWRRGYLDLPPPLAITEPQHPVNDPRYADVPAAELPSLENLDLTRDRVMAFWLPSVTPRLVKGERLLVSAHGNTLRALIMALDNMSVTAVEQFEIPTATPIIYRFDRSGTPLGWHYLQSEPCIGCAA
jgi:2,3-bisphosphoglycerate-dependent phosphoglycerate mutase